MLDYIHFSLLTTSENRNVLLVLCKDNENDFYQLVTNYIAHKSSFLFVSIESGQSDCTNTKSVAKEFSEILIFEYFGRSKIGTTYFLTLIPNHPACCRVKMQP